MLELYYDRSNHGKSVKTHKGINIWSMSASHYYLILPSQRKIVTLNIMLLKGLNNQNYWHLYLKTFLRYTSINSALFYVWFIYRNVCSMFFDNGLEHYLQFYSKIVETLKNSQFLIPVVNIKHVVWQGKTQKQKLQNKYEKIFMCTYLCISTYTYRLPSWLSGEVSACHCRRLRLGTIPWRKKRQPTPIFLHEKSHGKRNQVDCSQEGHKASDTIKWWCVHTYIHIPP